MRERTACSRRPDDHTLLNQINVPVNRPITVHLRAEDVLHSFFLPDMRVKQDAVPGMSIPVWFEATAPGEYTIGCAELCGLGHYTMDGLLVVQTESEFEQWESQEQVAALERASPLTGATAALPDRGGESESAVPPTPPAEPGQSHGPAGGATEE